MTVSTALSDLGLAVPLLAAPMAGGPTTPALVTAAARAGGLGDIDPGIAKLPPGSVALPM